jgi:hypothetical protein
MADAYIAHPGNMDLMIKLRDLVTQERPGRAFSLGIICKVYLHTERDEIETYAILTDPGFPFLGHEICGGRCRNCEVARRVAALGPAVE